MLRLITTAELGRLRALDAAELERQEAGRRWVAIVKASPNAVKVLPPDAPAPHGHGAECRSSYISELEARVRRLQGRLDEAMGYDPETSRRLDAGATALWRDTVRW